MFDRFKQMLGKRQDGPAPASSKSALEWVADGRFAATNGRIADAIAAYENAIELEPTQWDALAGLADLYNKQGKLDEALEMFQRAVASEPTLQDAHYQMGHIYLKRKDIVKAAQSFENELKVTPKSGRVHNDLAVAYFHLKKFDQAIEHCDEATKCGEYVNEKFLAAIAPYRRK